MSALLKVALGAVLAAVIVRYAGRGTVLRSLLDRPSGNDVPVVYPEVYPEDAPGARF